MYQDLATEQKVVRLVLERRVTRENVIQHAISQRWTALGTQERTANKTFQYIWRTEDGTTRIIYVEDEDFGFAYLSVGSADLGALRRVVDAIYEDTDRVPIISDDLVQQRFNDADTHDERMDAIYLVSLASPKDCDPAWMQYYERATADPDPDVRRAALFAMSQSSWPQFQSSLAKMEKEDPDEKTRGTAADLLAILSRKYGPEATISAA